MTLEPADYWKLRALDGDLAQAQQRAQVLHEKRQAFWASLMAKYELDPAKNYRATDDTCELTEG